MMNIISTIFWKDLRETLRDKRNLMRMFFLPFFLIPMMGHFFLEFVDNHADKLDKKILEYTIIGDQFLPELAKMYADETSFHRVDVPEEKLTEAIRKKTINFALKIPENAKQQLGKREGINVTFMYYQSAPSHGIIKERGTAPLSAYSQKQRDWQLTFLGVVGANAQSKLLDPVTFDVVNTASDRERIGHNLGTILAYPLLIICFMGCAFTAVELATGEREKGTLEILVMLPIPRTYIILAKYLVVLVLGLLYSTLSMVSISTWLFAEGMNSTEAFKSVLTQIGVGDIFLVWLMLVPVNALFAAVLLAISTYAKSYREANALGGFANFLVVITATAIFMPGVNLTWLWSMVPVSNVGLVIRELIKGTLTNYLMIGSIFATTIVIGTAALLFSVALFRRESVIFRN